MFFIMDTECLPIMKPRKRKQLVPTLDFGDDVSKRSFVVMTLKYLEHKRKWKEAEQKLGSRKDHFDFVERVLSPMTNNVRLVY